MGDRLARGDAPVLLVGGEEDTEGSAVALGLTDRGESDREASLHVADAGAEGTIAGDAEGPRCESPAVPHRVEVTEQEERRLASAEVRAHVLAEPLRPAAEGFELGREPFAERPRLPRRRLDLDELPQDVEQLAGAQACVRSNSSSQRARSAWSSSRARR